MRCEKGWKGESYRDRGKEGCVLLSPRAWKGIETHEWKESRIVWAVGKIGIVKYAWVCVDALVNVGNERGRE